MDRALATAVPVLPSVAPVPTDPGSRSSAEGGRDPCCGARTPASTAAPGAGTPGGHLSPRLRAESPAWASPMCEDPPQSTGVQLPWPTCSPGLWITQTLTSFKRWNWWAGCAQPTALRGRHGRHSLSGCPAATSATPRFVRVAPEVGEPILSRVKAVLPFSSAEPARSWPPALPGPPALSSRSNPGPRSVG